MQSWKARREDKGKPEIQPRCRCRPALGKLTDSRLLPALFLTYYLFFLKVKCDWNQVLSFNGEYFYLKQYLILKEKDTSIQYKKLAWSSLSCWMICRPRNLSVSWDAQVYRKSLEGGMKGKSPFSTKFYLERNICSLMYSFICRIAISSKTQVILHFITDWIPSVTSSEKGYYY